MSATHMLVPSRIMRMSQITQHKIPPQAWQWLPLRPGAMRPTIPLRPKGSHTGPGAGVLPIGDAGCWGAPRRCPERLGGRNVTDFCSGDRMQGDRRP